jgi:hypothetical protein
LDADDGSCFKCKKSAGGALVKCDTNHKVEAWSHIEGAGLDKVTGENESWFCDECRKRDASGSHTSRAGQLGVSGGRQAKHRNVRNLNTRGRSTRRHQVGKIKRKARKGKARVHKREKLT